MNRTGTASESAGFRVRLPCERASVPEARALVCDWCREVRLGGGLIADVQLAVTEAVTNAVRHSGCAHFEVLGRISEGALCVRVWDRGRGRGDPEAGLGTGIIRAVAGSVEFEDTHPGTRVTMRFGRRSAP